MRLMLATAATLALTACQTTTGEGMNGSVPPASAPQPGEPPQTPDGIATCDPGKVQNHIGHSFTVAMGNQIQQQAGARSTRVIRPGQAVTMDYRSDRLNIELDAQDKIVAIRCG